MKRHIINGILILFILFLLVYVEITKVFIEEGEKEYETLTSSLVENAHEFSKLSAVENDTLLILKSRYDSLIRVSK